ncbi:MAG: diguanylate cyclase [Gemmatimonadetes bacterium]|nr:diguanylate cyclase [Gemmatimonadota bacterium]
MAAGFVASSATWVRPRFALNAEPANDELSRSTYLELQWRLVMTRARGVSHFHCPLMSSWSIFRALAVGVALMGTAAPGQAQGTPPQAAPVTIAKALAGQVAGREVSLAGRALVSSGKLQSSVFDIAIEDATGGIRIFSRTQQQDVHEGDSVMATGVIKTYRGNVELAATHVNVINTPRRLIPPRDISIDPKVLEQNSGLLVRVHGRAAGFGHSEGGQYLRVRDASSAAHGTLTIWVPANHGAPINLERGSIEDSLTVTGIVTAYKDNADDPMVWQLVPRDAADVQITAQPPGLRAWLLWIALGIAVIIGIALAVSRIAARRQLRALRETEARYSQLLALLPDAVIVHARGEILFTNPAAAELLQMPSEQALAQRPLVDFVLSESHLVFADRRGTSAPGERAPRMRAKMVTANGDVVDVEVASSPCVYHDRPATVALVRDITSQLRYERDLHALALVDDLTGLQNRRAFTLFAEQELARARRHGRTPVLVFADLDGLKRINDQFGHAAGDTAIKLVGNALRSIFRETDVVARWSGDEFVALMVDGSEEATDRISSRLDAAIMAQSPATLPYVVTASIGACPLDPALPLRDAMERADAELYAQKKRIRRSKIRHTPMGVDAIKDEH